MDYGKLEQKMNSMLEPISIRVNSNKTLMAISEGFLRTTPITLGIALFAIIGSLPIPFFQIWLKQNNLDVQVGAVLGASTSILSLYATFSIAYCYAKNQKQNGLTSGLLALLALFIMMPQEVVVGEESIPAILVKNLGGESLFVGLLTAIIIAKIFVFFGEHDFVFKMPDTVPSMVSESLSPAVVSMVIVAFALTVRIAFSFTRFETVFSFVFQIISVPVMALGASVPSLLFLLTLANFLWFFGIHPNTIYGPLMPISMAVVMANMEAFQAGKALPYATLSIVTFCAGIGGTGGTFSLIITMLTAKSERYKSLVKLAGMPNFFNINEPLIFGFPVMLNPIMFIPFVFSSTFMGVTGLILCQFLKVNLNPAMSLLPFSTPFLLKGFIGGGFTLVLIVTICFIVNTIITYPFFKIADNKALMEEKEAKIQKEELQ